MGLHAINFTPRAICQLRPQRDANGWTRVTQTQMHVLWHLTSSYGLVVPFASPIDIAMIGF